VSFFLQTVLAVIVGLIALPILWVVFVLLAAILIDVASVGHEMGKRLMLRVWETKQYEKEEESDRDQE
jgi:hypothetical protein